MLTALQLRQLPRQEHLLTCQRCPVSTPSQLVQVVSNRDFRLILERPLYANNLFYSEQLLSASLDIGMVSMINKIAR